MKERAYAKINLALNVVSRREDGYHELEMIMVPIDFYDVLEMNIAPETTISINRGYLPSNDKNSVIKAIRIMRQKYGFEEQFSCVLQKHIPTQAGLAGGSADAAAAIRMINQMLKLKMTQAEMIEVGKQVGADVPFCLLNKPSFVCGIGEQLHPFEIHTDFRILLVKPKRGVSTKSAFKKLDLNTAQHPDCIAMAKALISDDYQGVIDHLGNSLEDVSIKLVRDIGKVKQALIEEGFDGVLMSGSGSTVFGISRDEQLVKRTEKKMREKGYFTRSTKIITM